MVPRDTRWGTQLRVVRRIDTIEDFLEVLNPEIHEDVLARVESLPFISELLEGVEVQMSFISNSSQYRAGYAVFLRGHTEAFAPEAFEVVVPGDGGGTKSEDTK